MFEKEAKKHKEEFITAYISAGGGLKAADMIGAQKEQSYQEGAEFGYNKCDEQLIKAKEIMREMLRILPKENIEGVYEITEEAEQFLRELEE